MNYPDIVCIACCIACCIAFCIAFGVAMYKLQSWKKKFNDKDRDVKYLKNSLAEVGAIHDSNTEHLNDIIKKREKEISDLNDKLKNVAEKSESDFTGAVETAVNDRIKEIEAETHQSMEEIIKELDTNVGNQLKELISNHTLYFQCACSKNPADKIPCYIDFTKQNEFQCKKCGAMYRVQVDAYPILLTKTINESTLADEIQKQLDERFSK